MGELAVHALEKEYTLSPYARFLKKHGMISAALYYKNLNETLERRVGRTSRFHFENRPVPEYEKGQRIFATYGYNIVGGRQNDDLQGYGCSVGWDGQCYVWGEGFRKLLDVAENDQERHIIHAIMQNAHNTGANAAHIRYQHGGMHHVVDFEFMLKKGILGYKTKIEAELEFEAEEAKRQFLLGVKDTLEGVIEFVGRYSVYLNTLAKETPEDRELVRLAQAVAHVPLQPARSFYEAFVTMHAAMVLSDCFEMGRIDELLYPYYKQDLEQGKATEEEAYALMRELLADTEKRLGHPSAVHVTIGGTNKDNEPSYNTLTKVTIQAIRGLRTPNVSLRVRSDMPQEIWDECLYNIGQGHGQPSLVSEELFVRGLIEQYNIPFEDAIDYVFGGCSEVLIQGKTACDATWVAYNMLDIFEHTFYNTFMDATDFDAFKDQYKKDLETTVKDMGEQINILQHTRGIHIPHPVRTLMTGGCIENRKSYMNGGATYNFDSTNIYGSTNAINALYTVKAFYEGKLGEVTKEEFLQAFINNYEGYEEIYDKCQEVIKFGNFDEDLNALAGEISGKTFDEVKKLRCHRGNGYFMPAMILWTTWISCGQKVGATPDGRKSGEPLADSIGAMQGTDHEGPTSLLGAALSLAQKDCVGTAVLNLRLDSKNFKTPEGVQKVQYLFETYFEQGGCQLQVSVVDKATLEDAIVNPEKHRDIIVRVGGFSDNFVLLDKKIQAEFIKRTEY